MILLISFVARHTEISMFLLNSSGFGRNKECPSSFCKNFLKLLFFLTVCLVFGSYKYFGAFEYQKSPRLLPFWQIIPI